MVKTGITTLKETLLDFFCAILALLVWLPFACLTLGLFLLALLLHCVMLLCASFRGRRTGQNTLVEL